jgi:hypothetical protein
MISIIRIFWKIFWFRVFKLGSLVGLKICISVTSLGGWCPCWWSGDHLWDNELNVCHVPDPGNCRRNEATILLLNSLANHSNSPGVSYLICNIRIITLTSYVVVKIKWYWVTDLCCFRRAQLEAFEGPVLWMLFKHVVFFIKFSYAYVKILSDPLELLMVP